MDERIFRTYTSEEVIEALDYIGKNSIINFEFISHDKNPPLDDIVTRVITPYRNQEPYTYFEVNDYGNNGMLLGGFFMSFTDSRVAITEIEIDFFEGWCPYWEIVNIKPAKRD